ncbi:flagellar assembly protein FliH [Deefgea salmonis]|uniref:Flagellar assembly protein FliH n=1 Tax=Deefgea salmonis TaxID=2875502 RepID=A0ABS8BKH6_9NEIS|nr:flagellar assembly protein FliH [Deefgea salmonis]MCB5196211.1 flagellar assembly protein FliH [Deefgea salmonis]
MSGPHRRVIPREELSEFQLWQFNSLLDTPKATPAPPVVETPEEIESIPEPLASPALAPEAALPIEPSLPLPTAEEIEAIQQQAHHEGFQAGLEAGRLAGEAETQQLLHLLGHITETLAQGEAQLAESVLDLALLAARQMICDELKSQPKQLLAPIREALAMMPTASHPSRLFLSPEDFELLHLSLQIELPDDVWRLVADPNLLSGSCKIETPATQLSFSLASRWENILRVLKRNERTDLAWGQYPSEETQAAPATLHFETPAPAITDVESAAIIDSLSTSSPLAPAADAELT